MAIGTTLAQLIKGRKWYKRPISKQAKHNIVEATEDRYIAEGRLSPRPEPAAKEKPQAETTRTEQVSSQLRNAGLTEEEIDRLKGKKKKTMMTGKK